VGGGLVVPQEAKPISERSAEPGLRLPDETLRESIPARAIVLLQKRRLQSEARRPDDIAALEHEGKGVVELLWREGRIHRALERIGIGSVTGHAIVEARAARHETLALRVVGSANESHELAHHVAMEPRRPEAVLCDHPAWRKDHEVHIGGARRIRG